MTTTVETIKLKKRFTSAEIEAMKQPQRESLRFLVEGEDGKPKLNIYRIRLEDGIGYCNSACSELFETYNGILKLRVMSRVSNTEWKELGHVQRDKEGAFDGLLLGDEYEL